MFCLQRKYLTQFWEWLRRHFWIRARRFCTKRLRYGLARVLIAVVQVINDRGVVVFVLTSRRIVGQRGRRLGGRRHWVWRIVRIAHIAHAARTLLVLEGRVRWKVVRGHWRRLVTIGAHGRRVVDRVALGIVTWMLWVLKRLLQK